MMTQDEMIAMIREINHEYLQLQEKKELLKKSRDELKDKLNVLEPFRPLELDLHKALRYRYMKIRFGRIGVDYYRKLEKYLFEDLNAVFLEGIRNENFVYGCYFVSNAEASRVDSVFNSLHFERISISGEYIGTPSLACESLQQDIDSTNEKIDAVDKEIEELEHRSGWRNSPITLMSGRWQRGWKKETIRRTIISSAAGWEKRM